MDRKHVDQALDVLTGHLKEMDPVAAKAILEDLAEHAGVDMVFTLINWNNIRRKAGPNEQWPGRPCYCYCSTQSLDAPETWLPAVRVEADAQGWEMVVHAGNVYLLGPQELSHET
jgi:hypothetical protein